MSETKGTPTGLIDQSTAATLTRDQILSLLEQGQRGKFTVGAIRQFTADGRLSEEDMQVHFYGQSKKGLMEWAIQFNADLGIEGLVGDFARNITDQVANIATIPNLMIGWQEPFNELQNTVAADAAAMNLLGADAVASYNSSSAALIGPTVQMQQLDAIRELRVEVQEHRQARAAAEVRSDELLREIATGVKVRRRDRAIQVVLGVALLVATIVVAFGH
jgi:hypothetical protein